MSARKLATWAMVPALALAACNDPETYREPRRVALDANGDAVAEPRYVEPAHTDHHEGSDSMLPWLLFGASTAHTEWRSSQARERDKQRDERDQPRAYQPTYTPAPRFRSAEPRRPLSPVRAPGYSRPASPPARAPAPAKPSSPPVYHYAPRPAYRSPPTYNRPPAPAYRSSPSYSRGGRR